MENSELLFYQVTEPQTHLSRWFSRCCQRIRGSGTRTHPEPEKAIRNSVSEKDRTALKVRLTCPKYGKLGYKRERYLNEFTAYLRSGVDVYRHFEKGEPKLGSIKLDKSNSVLKWTQAESSIGTELQRGKDDGTAKLMGKIHPDPIPCTTGLAGGGFDVNRSNVEYRRSTHSRWSSAGSHEYFPLSSAELLTIGRSTANLLRTTKYYVESTSDLSESTCFSIHFKDGQSLDLECRDIEQAPVLLLGLSQLLGVKIDKNRAVHQIKPPAGVSAFCTRVVLHERFNKVVLVLIIISTLSMTLESPIESASTIFYLNSIQDAATVLFTIEAVIRVLAYEGLRPYLKNSWNVLDGSIVLLSLAMRIPSLLFGLELLNFHAFRALRGLRALRYIEGVRQLIDTVAGVRRMVISTLLGYLFMVLLFACVGYHAFGGSLAHQCSVVDDMNITQNETRSFFPIFPTKYCSPDDESTCDAPFSCQRVASGGSSDLTGFQSIGSSFLTVYMVSNRGGMQKFLVGTMQEHGPVALLYFVMVILLITYTMQALFIAIVRASFVEQQKGNAMKKIVKRKNSIKGFGGVQVSRHNPILYERPLEGDQSKNSGDAWEYAARIVRHAYRVGSRPQKLKIAEGVHKQNLTKENVLAEGVVSRGRISPPVKAKEPRIFFMLAKDSGIARYCTSLISSPRFNLWVFVLIFSNMIFQATQYHNMPTWHIRLNWGAECFFSFFFSVELLLKIIGYGGFKSFVYSDQNGAWNKLDFVIVVVSILDLVVSSFHEGNSGSRGISILRSLRVLRAVKLARFNENLKRILVAILKSIASMVNLLSFMCLSLVVFAIMGMQLYGGKFVSSRATFDSFSESLITLFRLFSGGDPWQIFFEAYSTPYGWTAPFYFGIFTVFTSYITLNFLVVILLSSFNPSEAELSMQRGKLAEEKMLRFQKKMSIQNVASSADRKVNPKPSHCKELVPSDHQSSEVLQKSCSSLAPEVAQQLCPKSDNLTKDTEDISQNFIDTNHDVPSSKHRASSVLDIFRLSSKSLMVFEQTSSVRKFCRQAVRQTQDFVIICIVVGCMLLVLETSILVVPPRWKYMLDLGDYIFVGIFGMEFVIKVVANGLVFGREAYMADPWNRLDFVILFMSLFGIISPSTSSVGSGFLVARTLRPLRLINRYEAIQVITGAVARSATEVSYAVLIIIFYFLLFGILGVELFKGKYFACNDTSIHNVLGCYGAFIPSSDSPLAVPRVWKNAERNFDNIFQAVSTLFQVASLKAWLPVLYSAMDSTAENVQPQRNAFGGSVVYFVLFIFIGPFFLYKVFVGIIVGNFRKFSGTALLTEKQLFWLQMKRVMKSVKPKAKVPQNIVRKLAFHLVHNPVFEALVAIACLSQVAILSFFLEPAHATGKEDCPLLASQHRIFTTLYAIEMCLKLIAQRPQVVLREGKNLMETLLVLCMIFLGIWRPRGYAASGVLRCFSLGKFLKILERFLPGVRALLEALSNSRIAIANITLLFLIFLFMYASLGVKLFRNVKWGTGFDSNANFDTFPSALKTLFQVAAGENWIVLLQACMVGPPSCSIRGGFGTSPDSIYAAGDCGFPITSLIFFYSFFIVVFLVFVNLYVATILDTYAASVSGTGPGKFTLSERDFEKYQQIWSNFDPDGTGLLPLIKLQAFLMALGPPLGFNPISEMQRYDVLRQECQILSNSRSKKGIWVTKLAIYPVLRKFGLFSKKRPITESVSFFELLSRLAISQVPNESLDIDDVVSQYTMKKAVEIERAKAKIRGFIKVCYAINRNKGSELVPEGSEPIPSVVTAEGASQSNPSNHDEALGNDQLQQATSTPNESKLSFAE